jgi:hypothetical protein
MSRASVAAQLAPAAAAAGERGGREFTAGVPTQRLGIPDLWRLELMASVSSDWHEYPGVSNPRSQGSCRKALPRSKRGEMLRQVARPPRSYLPFQSARTS